MTVGRWRVGLVGALALAGVGLLFAEPTLLGAAVVPLVYVCYGVVSGLSTAPTLRATREFDPERPGPGERVTVRLRVENAGDSVVPDVRVVDGVPDLAVVEGAPRGASALAPGERLTVSYDVVARRGDHEFDGPLVRARSLSAAEQHTERPDVAAGESLTCRTPSRDQLAALVVRRLGQLSAGGRGEGTEFHATREYRRGDPMRRIDWRHVAKTGEFVTVEYRDQQTSKTAVVVDVRQPGRVRPVADHPSAATLSVEAADRLLTALDRMDLLAGLGVAGLDPDGPLATVGSVAWTDATGRQADPLLFLGDLRETVGHGAAAGESNAERPAPDRRTNGERKAAARPDGGPVDSGVSTSETTGPATPAETADTSDSVQRLLDQVPPGTQLVVCTPALDDWALAFGRAAVGRGHGLVVVSPDITATADGGGVAGLRRQLRLQKLAELGEVVDWTPGRSVELGGVS